MSYFKYLLLLVAVVFSVNTTKAQIIYEVEPDLNNCVPGKLTQETKDKIIKLINDIRVRHKLAPIPWNEDMENRPQSAALSRAVLGVENDNDPHGPKPGQKCSTPDSDSGRSQSNLSWSSVDLNYEDHIIGWLIDNYNNPPENVGHRRLIINPFLETTAYGEVYSNTTGDNAALWGITNGESLGNAVCENDFVAYPYENYPPDWVDKEFYLSFHPIPNINNWYTPGATNFTNAKIEVVDSNGNKMTVHSVAPDDGLAWGVFQHCLSFKVNDLKDSVRYNVSISNVIVNGTPKAYNYWFKLTDEPIAPPAPLATVPTLVTPTNNATNMEAPVEFKWNKSENAVSYHIIGSLSSSFSYHAFEAKDLTDTTFTVTEELLNNVTYYWKVEAYNIENVTSDYSEVWQFSTKEIIPEPPVVLYPLENTDTVARRDDYIWQSVEGTASYNLQIATSEDFATLTLEQTDIYDTTYHLTEEQSLNEFTDYYWRVKAILLSVGNETNWSEPIKYKTNDKLDGIIEEISGTIISCYPNPFNDFANITIEATQSNKVKIEIYNLLGTKVADLCDNIISEGKHNFIFEPKTYSEIYFCKIQIGNNSKIIPLNFIKK